MAIGGPILTFKYVPNLPVIEAAGDFYAHLALEELMPRMEAEARNIAPVDTGAYQASIETEIQGTTATLSSSIRYARYLEFGTSDTPTFATLRQASESVTL